MDLSRLFCAIFSHDDIIIEEIDKKGGDDQFEMIWRYIAKFYPWLVSEPAFAKAYFTGKTESQIFSILINLVDRGKLKQSELDTFTSYFSPNIIANIIRGSVISDATEYLLKVLIKDTPTDEIIRLLNLEHLHTGFKKDIIFILLKVYMLEDKDKEFRYILDNLFNGDEIEGLINFLTPVFGKVYSTKWIDYLFDFMTKLGMTDNTIYNTIIHSIFYYSIKPGDLDGITVMLKYMVKRSGETIENLFYAYVNSSSIQNKKFFYRAVYSAGLAYEFLLDYSVKNPDPALLEWLQPNDDV